MKEDTVIPVNDKEKNIEEERVRAGFEIAADMNENLIFAPQIYILWGLAGFQLLWTIILWIVCGFYWPLIFFFVPVPLLIAMKFLEILNIKWHFIAQTVAWTSLAVFLLIDFCVIFPVYNEAAQVNASLPGMGILRFYFAYIWISILVIIIPIVLILVRMTIHSFRSG